MLVRSPGNFVRRSAAADRGLFKMVDLPPGPAAVTTRADGYAPFVGSATIEGGKLTDLRIGLLLGAQAEGSVVDDGGTAVVGATVNVRT